MPVWGTDHKVRAAEHCADCPYKPEMYLRTRILSRIEYLGRLQKP